MSQSNEANAFKLEAKKQKGILEQVAKTKVKFPFVDKDGVKHNTWYDYNEYLAMKEFTGR